MTYNMKDLEEWNIRIEQIAKESKLDYYPQEFEVIGYNEMLGYESYTGMPSRYPHWSFGKSYEKNKMLYKYNLTGLPYEMVINSDPCLAYLMRENTLLLQILTMAHVYGHNDFFKNNRLFKLGTNAGSTVEKFKVHAQTIRSYINDPSIGCEEVEKVLDAAHALRMQTTRQVGIKRVSDEEIKEKMISSYLNNQSSYSLLDGFVKKDMPDISKIPLSPEEDILYFLVKYGDMEEWKRNVISIVRDEELYFMPQIETKIMNEGWASYWHYNILKKLELTDGLYLEFIKRHNDVVAPIVGGLNPYYLGFRMFQDIASRYGEEKIYEVRELERDASFIRKYLTEELCSELNLFEYSKSLGDIYVKNISDKEGFESIRNSLASTCGMGSVPYIVVDDMNIKDKSLTIHHVFDGRELSIAYAEGTLRYLQTLWGYRVRLKTTLDEKEIIFECGDDKKISILN